MFADFGISPTVATKLRLQFEPVLGDRCEMEIQALQRDCFEIDRDVRVELPRRQGFAVMRRLSVIIRNMLVQKQSYAECRDAMIERCRKQLKVTKPEKS